MTIIPSPQTPQQITFALHRQKLNAFAQDRENYAVGDYSTLPEWEQYIVMSRVKELLK